MNKMYKGNKSETEDFKYLTEEVKTQYEETFDKIGSICELLADLNDCNDKWLLHDKYNHLHHYIISAKDVLPYGYYCDFLSLLDDIAQFRMRN